MIRSVTLLGSSSGRNAGDAALLSGIMDSIDEKCGSRLLYEIPTIRPEYIYNNYGNRVRAVSMMPWSASIRMLGIPTFQSIMRTDLSLIFDAILFDRALFNPLFNFLSTLYLMLPAAKKRGKRIGCYNVGIGPVTTPLGKRMLRELADLMDFITVRDQDSADILREIGVSNPRIYVTADAALNVQAAAPARIDEIFQTLGFHEETRILGVNINQYIDTWAGATENRLTKEAFIRTCSESLNECSRKLNSALLFICTQHHDVAITTELMSAVRSDVKKALVSNVQYNHYEIKGILSRVSLLFAMRLHAMILATSELTPVLGLAYQPKCHHYFNALGLPELMMPFTGFSAEDVVSRICAAWERKDDIRRQLATIIPQLKGKALQAAEFVAAINRT